MAGRKQTTGGGSSSNRSRKSSISSIQNDPVRSNRSALVLVLFFAFAVIFLGRLIYLQVVVADEYSNDAQNARTTNIKTSPRRGTIYDRNGNVLATSTEATTIYVNPYEVTDINKEAKQLADVLEGEEAEYREKLSQKDISYVYIKRKADVDVAERVKELKLDGIYFVADTKRVYPYGSIGGQVIGFVGVDGEGLTGLELYYDDILRGSEGRLVVERGAQGIPIPGGVKEETVAVDGEDIIITLDIELQEYLEKRLEEGIKDLGGTSGNSIVMDSSTGEVFACASLPLFDPSNTNDAKEGATQLKSITNSFEPGSIFKTISVLAVLETGTMTAEDSLDCPSSISADGYTVSDAHDRDAETMTLRQILDKSSNVGISLATKEMGYVPLYDKITSYKLAQTTGIDYPGEATGYLANQSDWSLIQSYNISFGQGIAVTPLQMTSFYGALANNGVQITPHFLLEKPLSDEKTEYESTEIMKDKESVNTLTDMLTTVVTEGTGKKAQIEGYTVAGKTSTAEIPNEGGGYKGGVYNICFAGFLPESSPQLTCFVGVEEVPSEGTATVIFKDIMTFAIERYKITPQ